MKVNGPMPLAAVKAYLSETILPLRLAAVSPSEWPMVVSLWFLYENQSLICATKRSSRIAESLIGSERCGFEIARETAPYFGIRGQGVASVNEGGATPMLERLAERYLGDDREQFQQWLLRGAKDEIIINIRPIAFHSWDYRKRMAA
ncbi:hypothetical protein N9452_00880 [Alphaproteobacteria bacterium]|nr:hypothetical protein [Alphaproteobacteria bacterium]